MTQTDFEPNLSFVILSDDGYTLLLNGESNYSVTLPMDISRKEAPDRLNAIESTIRNVCNSFGLDTVSEENVRQKAEQVEGLLDERWAILRRENGKTKSRPKLESTNDEGQPFNNTTKEDYALESQGHGFSVFPIKNPDHREDGNLELEKTKGVEERKQPAVESLDEFKKQAMTAEAVRKMFDENPDTNYGIFCGKVSNNLIIIDADGEGDNRINTKIINNPQSNLRPIFLNTMVVTSGGGGKHYYLLLNDPIIETLGTKKIWSTDEEHTEITIIGNGRYAVGAGCRHPNNNIYLTNGKRPIPITRKELEEFIREVAANPDYVIRTYLGNNSSSANNNNGSVVSSTSSPSLITVATSSAPPYNIDNNAPEETLLEIYETIKPFYIDGDRNEIIYNLSGFMCKDGGFSLNDCEFVTTKLGKNSGYADENLVKSLDVVRRTYNKQELKNVKGKSGLYDVLVGSKDTQKIGLEGFRKRSETYNKIAEIIYKHKHKNEPESLVEGCIIMEPIHPEGGTYMTAFSKDNFWDKITEGSRPIRAIRQLEMEWDDKNRKYVEKFGALIINAIPVPPITRIYDPLFQVEKYKIIFEYVGVSNTIRQKIVGPYTKEELIDYLKRETTFIHKEKSASEALNQVIAGYERKNMLVERTETETEGLIWSHIDNKLFLSQRTLCKPTPEECRACIKVTGDLQKQFYQPTEKTPLEQKRFSHFYKVGIAGPTSFARRQIGAVGDDNWIPLQDLAGWPKVGKSYGYAGLALRLYRLPLHGSTKYDISSGSVETESRFIEHTKLTTFPVIFEDIDWLSDPENRKTVAIMPLIKNQVSMTNPRDIQSTNNKRQNLPSCAYIMLTHNSKLVNEEGFGRRATGHEFTVHDEKTPEQRVKYEQFFKENGYVFGYLGDFALWYYVEHPEVLKHDWITMAQIVLKAFYKHAGYSEEQIPKWLLEDVVTSATSQEALAEHLTSGIINTLHDLILNKFWHDNKRDIVYFIAKELKMSNDDLNYFYQNLDKYAAETTLKEKLEAISRMGTIPYFRWHNDYEICIGNGFIEELKKKGYNRLSLTQIPSFCSGMKYNDHVRFGGRDSKKNYMVTIKLDDLTQLLTLSSPDSRQTVLSGLAA
jgi:hypothetical protein